MGNAEYMGSSAWPGYHLIAITMLSLLVITLGIAQINAQHGDMGGGMGDGMGSDMGGGMGNGMGSGIGNGMGYGMGSGMGSGMGGGMDYGYTDMPYGSGMGGMGYGMGGDCCPRKKIWGSMNQKMDGMYVNVGKMPWGKLPRRCNSDCVYERMGSYDGLKYCFGDSMYSQSECDADMGDGEEPVDMGPGSGDMGSGYGEGSGYGDGSDGESPVDMGPGGESGM